MPGGGFSSPTRTVNVPVIGSACGDDLAHAAGGGDRRVVGQRDDDRLRAATARRSTCGGTSNTASMPPDARDAHDHLAGLHDLARLGAARGHRAGRTSAVSTVKPTRSCAMLTCAVALLTCASAARNAAVAWSSWARVVKPSSISDFCRATRRAHGSARHSRH